MAKTFKAQAFVGKQRNSSSDAAVQLSAKDARAAMADVVKNLQNLCESIAGNAPEAMMSALGPVFAESQDLVPKDTHELARSGFLEIVQSGKYPAVQIGYGRGGDPEYAAIVHEDLEAQHEYPTQAKYLEKPLREHEGEYEERIAAFIRMRIGM